MADDKLSEYRRKRDPARTPEPVPPGPLPRGDDDTFVIQQHHARALHWDLRLERGGVLVSWALPRGVPRDPARNHLAVHTEDHPIEYAEFHGEIPAGEYGGGRMYLYDRGTYVTEKWRDDEVIVVFDGVKTKGRYVLFQTRGKDWMIHRMDPRDPGWSPLPEPVAPMRPRPTNRLPQRDADWAYELAWAGRRAVADVSGGRLLLRGADGAEVTRDFPALRALGDALAPTEVRLDGVLVAFDERGVPDRAVLERARATVQYMIFDVLWLDGVSTVDEPYTGRRELLDGLALTGPHWQTPPHFIGGGRSARDLARERGLPGVVAKRLNSPYRSGEQTDDWRLIPVL